VGKPIGADFWVRPQFELLAIAKVSDHKNLSLQLLFRFPFYAMWTGYPHAQLPNPSSILAGRQAGFFLCADHDQQLGGASPLPT
jgi:hypothetical protein